MAPPNSWCATSAPSDAPVYVGVAGQTAAFLDLEHSLGAHLPAVLGVIVAATLIVLFLFTGSVVLPLKAVVMNMLSLSAVLGILVLIFQDGRLQGLLSYTSQGALDATQPIFLAAVAFGLATDYGVFLLSRIKEARDRGISDSEAVAVGLERTGRIVTAAAILFAVAIGAFATSEARVHQGAGTRRRARRADRRLDHPRPAGAIADGTARPVELVGTETAAAGARPDRPARERTARHPDTGAVALLTVQLRQKGTTR